MPAFAQTFKCKLIELMDEVIRIKYQYFPPHFGFTLGLFYFFFMISDQILHTNLSGRNHSVNILTIVGTLVSKFQVKPSYES